MYAQHNKIFQVFIFIFPPNVFLRVALLFWIIHREHSEKIFSVWRKELLLANFYCYSKKRFKFPDAKFGDIFEM